MNATWFGVYVCVFLLFGLEININTFQGLWAILLHQKVAPHFFSFLTESTPTRIGKIMVEIFGVKLRRVFLSRVGHSKFYQVF